MHCSLAIELKDTVTLGNEKKPVEITFPYVLQTALPSDKIRDCLYIGIGQNLGPILDAALAELAEKKTAMLTEYAKKVNDKKTIAAPAKAKAKAKPDDKDAPKQEATEADASVTEDPPDAEQNPATGESDTPVDQE